MGITIHYHAQFATDEPIETKKIEMERIALNAAIEWADFFKLPEPTLLKDNSGAVLELFTGVESFGLWRGTSDKIDEYCKTQYSENPLAHIQVAMIIKALVDSDLFIPDSIEVKDEGDCFGHWDKIDRLIDALADNRKVLDSIGSSGKDHPNERLTKEERDRAKQAYYSMLTEKDRLISNMAELYAQTYLKIFETAFDPISYPWSENRVYDLQTAICVYLYRYNINELESSIDEDKLRAFAENKVETLITSVKSWWKPEYAQNH